MKLAMIGSYGHWNLALDGAVRSAGVQLSAVARYGPDDPLPYLGKHPAAPAGMPVYDDYREMLDAVRPDAVGVFTPLHRLARTSIDAARRGCHILSEKPLATTLEDLAALRSAVEASGVRAAAPMNLRGWPAFQAARQAVRDGRIGRPILACGQKSYPFGSRDEYYRQRRTYGGSIPWSAIHAIDFIMYCTGTDFVRVAAMHSNAAHPTHPGMEDNGGVLLELAGGGHAVVWFDYLRPWDKATGRSWGDDRLRIVGTEGTVEVVDEARRTVLMTPTAVEDFPLPHERHVGAEFLDSLQGRGEGLISTRESFRITEVALKARDAADAGRVVDL